MTSSTDVIVVGSGAGGLAAALAAAQSGADVVVLEGEATFGGTTAVSAGIVWVPAHDRGADAPMSVDDAMRYMDAHTHGTFDREQFETFVRTAPHTLNWIESFAPLSFRPVPGFLDDDPLLDGARSHGGRSFVVAPTTSIPSRWSPLLTAFPPEFSGVGYDVATGSKTGGKAGATLVAGLLEAVEDLGVQLIRSTKVSRLVSADGRIDGVVASSGTGIVEMRARRSVVIATGGFEWDRQLVDAFLRGGCSGATSPTSNRGDGLRLAMAAGADLGSMSEAWWLPVVQIPTTDLARPLRTWGFLMERIRPGSIMVNRTGQRFMDEARAFNSLAGPMHQLDHDGRRVNDPAWVVFDRAHLDRYGAFGVAAGGEPAVWWASGADLQTLASAAGIDPTGLVETVASWNRDVASGADHQFGRGGVLRSGWSGDDSVADPAKRTLGPVDVPPFFAVRVSVGVLGTKGGPRTDADGRVLRATGGCIAGLFAAGNVVGSPTGRGFGGPGVPLGLALVSGHRAGHAAATGDSLPLGRSVSLDKGGGR